MVQFRVAASSAAPRLSLPKAWGWPSSKSGATIPKSFGFEAATPYEATDNVTRNLTYLNHASILQNKANVKMGNINISPAQTKAYAKEQRTMSNERHPKQTQSNPILSRRSPERSRIPPPPSCAGKESRISERNAYPDLSAQHQRSRIQHRVSSIKNPASLRKTKPISKWAI